MSFRECFKPQEVDGFCMTPTYVQNRHLLDDYSVNEEDVWICGSPKSGTTWVQEMVWLLVNDLDYEGAKLSVNIRVPLWEYSEVIDFRPLAAKLSVKIPLFRADSLRFIKENKVKGMPMCIKTHMPFTFLPKQIKDGTKKPKLIFISRDPRDTCISYYHFARNYGGAIKTLEVMAHDYLEGRIIWGPQWDHTISYWNERHRSNLLILTYKEMVDSLPAVLRKVTDFLGKKITEEQLEKLADHLSFKEMKNNPAVSYKEQYDIAEALGAKNERGEFIRSGKTGSYKEELTPEMIARFDQLLLEKTKETGFKFI